MTDEMMYRPRLARHLVGAYAALAAGGRGMSHSPVGRGRAQYEIDTLHYSGSGTLGFPCGTRPEIKPIAWANVRSRIGMSMRVEQHPLVPQISSPRVEDWTFEDQD